MSKSMSVKFDQEMFKLLVSGKEVIIEQPDGSQWGFSLDPSISRGALLRIIVDAFMASERDS